VAKQRPRRQLVLLSFVPVLLLPMGWWKISEVELTPCAGLPAVVSEELSSLKGSAALMLDLAWVRQLAQSWPGVAAVDIRLELPGTLVVTTRAAPPRGTIAIGRSWHAITETGALGRVVDHPIHPVLKGFRLVDQELALGLKIGARLHRASSCEVQTVRLVTPSCFQVTLLPPSMIGDTDPLPVVIQVGAEATTAERWWSATVAAGTSPAPWTDLRCDNRVITRGDR